jgi:hypothetical protein
MISLTLELSADSEPVTGRVHVDEADRLAFNGYIELMSLLEEIRRASHTEPIEGEQ